MSGDEFSTFDAAYVLGALSPHERQAYEQHLHGCAECERAVREIAGIPGLLSQVNSTDIDAVHKTEPPRSLLPSLLARVQRQRRTARWGLIATSAAAACLLVVLVVGIVLTGAAKAASETGARMAAVAPSQIQAAATLSDATWGTRIDLRCRYDSTDGYVPDGVYTLTVTRRNGDTRRVASWRAVPHQVSTVSASTALREADITALRVLGPHGHRLLALRR